MRGKGFFHSTKVKIAALLAAIWPIVEIVDWIHRIRTVVDMGAFLWANIAELRTWIGPVCLFASAVLLLLRVQQLKRPRSILQTHFEGLNQMGKMALAKIMDIPAGIGDAQLRRYLLTEGFVDRSDLYPYLTGDINLLTHDQQTGAWMVAEPYKDGLGKLLAAYGRLPLKPAS